MCNERGESEPAAALGLPTLTAVTAKHLIEIRWHARAGQGAVTAAKIVAQTAMREGKYAQAFPEYGPERSGAPLKAYNRISEEPIRTHAQVRIPDIVIVSDPTLLRSEDIFAGVKADTVFLINSPRPAYKLALDIRSGPHPLYAVDATKIAFAEIGRHFPNMAMLGALVAATAIVGIDQLLLQVAENLGDKASFDAVQANLRAVRRGFHEAASAVANPADAPASHEAPAQPGWREMLPGSAIADAGNASDYVTGGWRTLRPRLNERCNDCLLCWFFCPDSAVVLNEGKVTGFDLNHCKGCGICAQVCPPRLKAIDMVPEGGDEERSS